MNSYERMDRLVFAAQELSKAIKNQQLAETGETSPWHRNNAVYWLERAKRNYNTALTKYTNPYVYPSGVRSKHNNNTAVQIFDPQPEYRQNIEDYR